MQDLSSQTEDRSYAPASGAQSFNHWTTRKVAISIFEWKKENSEIMQLAQTLALFGIPMSTTRAIPELCVLKYVMSTDWVKRMFQERRDETIWP